MFRNIASPQTVRKGRTKKKKNEARETTDGEKEWGGKKKKTC